MSISARRSSKKSNNDRLEKIVGITLVSKRAILGDQDSPKRAPESYVRLSWGCLGAIKSSRYA